MSDPLGDGISSVELLEVMGSDLTVVNAARVSFHKESSEVSDKDEALIRYLARNHHWTPFGQPQLQFRIKMPIFVARQWMRSNVGVVRNEVSRRYVDDEPEFYLPKEWRMRAENMKQGSSEELFPYSAAVTLAAEAQAEEARNFYNNMIKAGVAPEMARMILPLSTYTEFIETGSLAYYARVVSLRDESHAQLEIQHYARAVSELIRPRFPVSWEALTHG